MSSSAVDFIRKKEHEVLNSFKDWSIEKLGEVVQEFADSKKTSDDSFSDVKEVFANSEFDILSNVIKKECSVCNEVEDDLPSFTCANPKCPN